jgi:hypothetical protein
MTRLLATAVSEHYAQGHAVALPCLAQQLEERQARRLAPPLPRPVPRMSPRDHLGVRELYMGARQSTMLMTRLLATAASEHYAQGHAVALPCLAQQSERMLVARLKRQPGPGTVPRGTLPLGNNIQGYYHKIYMPVRLLHTDKRAPSPQRWGARARQRCGAACQRTE